MTTFQHLSLYIYIYCKNNKKKVFFVRRVIYCVRTIVFAISMKEMESV